MKPTKLNIAVSIAAIQAREAAGWSQAEAARQLGLTRNGLSLIETARHLPSFPVAVMLCKLLNFDMAAFYDYVVTENQGRDDTGEDTGFVSISSH